jgi:hypothetical protein
MGLEFDYPEEYVKYKTPKKPEPEEKADGGIIGRKGMFLGGFLKKPLTFYTPTGIPLLKEVSVLDLLKNPSSIAEQFLSTTSTPEIPLSLVERYNKYLSQAGSGTTDELYKSYRTNLDKKADGGRIGYSKGKRVKSSIDKLIEQLNKKTKGKKSMESVNPKTGEVTVPKRPIRKAEEPTGMTTMDPEPEIIDEKLITTAKKPIIRTTEDIEKEKKNAKI